MLHERIREVRRSKNVKQAVIANALGITVQAYSMKERGRRPITTVELEMIAAVLDVPVSLFFREEE
ncbi:helix-turn-helix domain-containing protein [Bacillus norwichensis]|uniref:Helix-turn-helix transcriptional regulator n=1 Tax=Bacillus norwichensis TaxID=2762217 RepID=A0ABR8VKT0_9BACI|nr:helix-turn-helix transcriptional regulator [Bacillus norwichensis]MBD8005371.1 helix-turn-helix transcriptional regulator [Bacillus norwichensis]